MRRLASLTLFPLFALFCGVLPGSAAAATGTAPTVSGGFPPVIGAVLTATPAAPVDSLGWETCDANSNLTGTGLLATGPTYTLQPSDAGTYVCAVELAPLTNLVVGVSDPVGPPTLDAAGTAVTQGETLTVRQGGWTGAATITDIWEDCDASGANCAPVASGATGLSYTITRSDVGSTIEVQESATSTSPTVPPASLTTAPTGLVTATPPVATSSPTVSGTAQVGDTLTVAPGSWSNQPTSYTYQWERCSSGTCNAIPNATSDTYVPVDADVGDTLEALVAGVVDGIAGTPYPSYPTNPVVGLSISPPPGPIVGPVVPVTHPRTSHAVGRLTATMRWTFRYAPGYTQILTLAVDGPARGSTIATECTGKGCPFRIRSVHVRRHRRCHSATRRGCRAPRTVNLEPEFARRRLRIGVRVTIMITRTHDIGKYYRFVVRARRAPSVRISCLAPGSTTPGKGCSGL